MLRQAILLSLVLISTTQAFSWGRVFNNEKPTGANAAGEHVASAHTRPEEAEAERPLPEALHEERTFHNAGTESNAGIPRFSEESTLREGGGVPMGIGQAREGEELTTLRKEVSSIREPLGPTAPERVEVVGVPVAPEHHVTDGLAEAIAGLMRVYNTLLHTDGQPVSNATAENGTLEAGTRAAAAAAAAAAPRSGGGGWAAVGVLGGVIVAAVIGIVLTGFGGRERESALYPPRGPAYV